MVDVRKGDAGDHFGHTHLEIIHTGASIHYSDQSKKPTLLTGAEDPHSRTTSMDGENSGI